MMKLRMLFGVLGRNDDEGGGGVVRLSEWLLGGCLKTPSLPTIVSRGWDATHLPNCPCSKHAPDIPLLVAAINMV